jgi:hypothetical protein
MRDSKRRSSFLAISSSLPRRDLLLFRVNSSSGRSSSACRRRVRIFERLQGDAAALQLGGCALIADLKEGVALLHALAFADEDLIDDAAFEMLDELGLRRRGYDAPHRADLLVDCERGRTRAGRSGSGATTA